MQLRAVEPKIELRALWPELRPELLALQRKCQEPWMPEDVWLLLVTGKATLMVIEEEGARRGWMVCEKVSDPFEPKPILHVWLGYGKGMLAHAEWVLAELDNVAKSIDASRVRLSSPRRGWSVALRQYFTPARVVWEREVQK